MFNENNIDKALDQMERDRELFHTNIEPEEEIHWEDEEDEEEIDLI